MHIILLTSGRIFGVAHGGEDRFTNSFGNWLAKENHNVTLIGIDFAGLRVRHLSYRTETNLFNRNKTKKSPRSGLGFNLVLAYRYFSYMLRSIIWTFQVLIILIIHLIFQITLINAQVSF